MQENSGIVSLHKPSISNIVQVEVAISCHVSSSWMLCRTSARVEASFTWMEAKLFEWAAIFCQVQSKNIFTLHTCVWVCISVHLYVCMSSIYYILCICQKVRTGAQETDVRIWLSLEILRSMFLLDFCFGTSSQFSTCLNTTKDALVQTDSWSSHSAGFKPQSGLEPQAACPMMDGNIF